jgi:hypothetical protein
MFPPVARDSGKSTARCLMTAIFEAPGGPPGYPDVAPELESGCVFAACARELGTRIYLCTRYP